MDSGCAILLRVVNWVRVLRTLCLHVADTSEDWSSDKKGDGEVMDNLLTIAFITACLAGMAWALNWVLDYADRKGGTRGKTMY